MVIYQYRKIKTKTDLFSINIVSLTNYICNFLYIEGCFLVYCHTLEYVNIYIYNFIHINYYDLEDEHECFRLCLTWHADAQALFGL